MRSHPEGGSLAQPHRGLVATVQAAGASRRGLGRRLRDRPGNDGRHPAAKPESQTVGVGKTSQTAEASEARVCVPPLRNGALNTSRQVRVFAPP
jgi:hypothetical protein